MALTLNKYRILQPINSQFELDAEARSMMAPEAAMVKFSLLRQFDIRLRKQRWIFMAHPHKPYRIGHQGVK